MRPIYLTDLDAVVRALLSVPEPDWPQEAKNIINKARIADKYRKRFHRPLMGYGVGTLNSAVPSFQNTRPTSCGKQYRRCLKVLLAELD